MHYRRSLIASALSLALLLGSAASWAFVTIGVSINLAPPVLPVYTQPPLPAPGYLWAPGYWAWSEDTGYYWVPGTWVQPPQPGLLWTPGYWGWVNGAYLWNEGYWGPTVGFYGGVNYGFGYGGAGYQGGYWQHGAFFYNHSVNNFGGVHITNVYNKTVINNVTVNNVSYNGGAGGIRARPTAAQLAYAHQPHVQPVAAQEHQEQVAQRNPQLRASVNHGRPAIAATARAGEFSGHGVVAAKYSPENRGENPEAPARGAEHPAHGNATPSPNGRTAHAPVRENAAQHPPAQHPAARPQEHQAPAPRHAAPPAEHRPDEHPNASARPSGQHPNQHARADSHNEHRPG